MRGFHFHYRVAMTPTLMLLVSFVFQLVAVLSVPVTSKIALCTYSGYKFGVFGLCSTSSDECSSVEIGYSKTTVSELQGFSLPSNARHSISNLLIVHPISTGFTFILFILSALTHFKQFNRSLRFLSFAIIWTLPTFLLCLLSFLVDILLFLPHLDWGGWIVLSATVLIAVAGTIICIMRRTASSRNMYDYNKQQADGNHNGEYDDDIEMFHMLPLNQTLGTVGGNNGSSNMLLNDDESDSNNKYDEDFTDTEYDDSEAADHNLNRNNSLAYDNVEAGTTCATSTASPIDIMRNPSQLSYRGYPRENGIISPPQNVYSINPLNSLNGNRNQNGNNNEVYDNEDESYYSYNPMNNTQGNKNKGFLREMHASLPPGEVVAPYPKQNMLPISGEDLNENENINPREDENDNYNDNDGEYQTFNQTPHIPRVATPTEIMDDDDDDIENNEHEILQQPVSPGVRGPRPIPADLEMIRPSLPGKFPMNNGETENGLRYVSETIAPSSVYSGDNDASGEAQGFRTLASGVKAPNGIPAINSHIFGNSVISSNVLSANEDNLSNSLLINRANGNQNNNNRNFSSDSIASSNFTSISQRPINPRYLENNRNPTAQRKLQQGNHPFRAVFNNNNNNNNNNQ
ncbi:hypothetical protein PACTADRAFT_82578 [Pachysolen tannophilus NRRL Y-2460]|uniref:PH-response regulator protein palI/RIM9 n=1 Tax=Pachysolen tannophilus NRRL Y-2460 TaxID=669874 RepID=A0A1E4TN86_PACTA|nr:hypothetical protein PACTADRAFT_82578 [Pachysolen tannophilus NRRL Y-2460]